jgi:ribosomal protein S18 acetylase RimI-like enzyme
LTCLSYRVEDDSIAPLYQTERREDPRDYLRWRKGSGGTVEILDINVESDRRIGRGREMVETLLEEVRKETHLVFAFTRQSNDIASQFYQALGFVVAAVVPLFYQGENDVERTAVLYCYRL